MDSRPAVRKSASQTLFSTISAHGSLLHQPTWQAVLWQVLFPLLDKVRSLSNSASSEKVDTSGNILIHHSRNTAQKQWAETQVNNNIFYLILIYIYVFITYINECGLMKVIHAGINIKWRWKSI